MPALKIYQNGASSYTGGVGMHERALRGEIRGWTEETARRQTRWLYTIDSDQLTGFGYAVTLTVRQMPATAVDFHRARKLYLQRIAGMGAIRTHWVIEWQERGHPHLHLAIYFEEELSFEKRNWLGVHWLQLSAQWESGLSGQHIDTINGPLGWLKYLGKHASRGAKHYQRAGIPEGWEKSGRMWGKGGDWPEIEPVELDNLSNPEFWRVRRIMRHWSRAQLAEKLASDPSRENRRKLWNARRKAARRPRNESSYQGISEWIGAAPMLRLVDYLERENR